MKDRWIEVRAVGPDQCVYFWVDADPVEKHWVLQRAVQFALQDRKEIDGLRRAVGKLYAQSEWCQFLE